MIFILLIKAFVHIWVMQEFQPDVRTNIHKHTQITTLSLILSYDYLLLIITCHQHCYLLSTAHPQTT